MKTNEVFKQKYWIRFELGLSGLEEKAYFNEVKQRSSSICNFLFSNNDDVYVINRISYLKEDSKHKKLDVHRFFKTKRTVKHLEHQVLPYEYERGCDLYGMSKESLLPLYHQYRSWILDYNRIQIDNVFEEGLSGFVETETERAARQYANELKVQSTGINLYRDNTCHISYLLEIPNDQSNRFEEEIGGTGFTLRRQSKDSDTSVYQVIKTEALALIDYQSELMNLYSKKYGGVYRGWEIERAF